MSALSNPVTQQQSSARVPSSRSIRLVTEVPNSTLQPDRSVDAQPRIEGDPEAIDEAWTVAVESLVLREGLDQACRETQAAIGRIQDRLAALKVRTARSEAGYGARRAGPASGPGGARGGTPGV